jgi:hypothetical protein
MTITSGTKFTTNKIPQYKYATHQAFTTGAGVSVDESSVVMLDVGQTSQVWTKDTDWKIKVAKQQNAANAYTRSKWVYAIPYYVRAAGHVQRVSTRYKTGAIRISLSGYTYLSGSTDSVLADQAVARYKRKLQSSLGNAQALVPTVELRELRKTISASASYSYDFVIALSKIRKTRGLSFVRYMQDKWLTYSFGIAPLVSDTLSLLKAVNSYMERPRGLHRIRSSAVKRWVTGGKSDASVPYGFLTRISTQVDHELRYTLDSGIDFSILAGNNYSLSEHLGLSEFGAKFPGLLWELTPYSWVFDYFTTVGAYLDDTFVIPKGSTKYLTRTRKYVATGIDTPDVVPDPVNFGAHVLHQKNLEPGYFQFVIAQREVLTSLPHAALRFRTVDEMGRNGVTKLLNLVSLLK